MGVEILWSSIQRQAKEQGRVQLLLRAKGDPDRLAEVLWLAGESVLVASERATIAAGGYKTAAGPVLMVDHEIVAPDEATQWYRDLAARLEAEGLTGKLTIAPHTPPPAWIDESFRSGLLPRAHLLYSVDTSSGTRRVPEASRHLLATAASAWLQTPDGQCYLETYGPAFLIDAEPELTMAIDAMVSQFNEFSAYVRGADGLRVSSVVARRDATTGVSIWQPGMTWPELVALLRQPLLWHPELLDYGFVRTISHTWTPPHFTDYPLPYSNTGATPFIWERKYGELRSRLAYNSLVVPDAHGIQILTSDHLAKAHDLSAWTITHVAPDRHLVEAPDLAPWYAQSHPDPATLAKARADFGDMIITEANIDQYPRLREHLV